MSGYKSAFIYGYTPNLLGLCGPKKKSEKKIISDFILGKKIPEKKIREIIESFKAACSYYRLIAKTSNKKDLLDDEVIRAYWIGNDFLPKVKQKDFGVMAKERFFLGDFPSGSLPHHSFHVLNVGRIGGKLSENLLDVCLIKWGRVKKIKSKKEKGKTIKVIVEGYQPLEKRGGKFILGKSVEKEVVWNKLLAPELKVGDWVSIHWGNVIEKINKKDLDNLKKYTLINLRAYSK